MIPRANGPKIKGSASELPIPRLASTHSCVVARRRQRAGAESKSLERISEWENVRPSRHFLMGADSLAHTVHHSRCPVPPRPPYAPILGATRSDCMIAGIQRITIQSNSRFPLPNPSPSRSARARTSRALFPLDSSTHHYLLVSLIPGFHPFVRFHLYR